MFGLQNYGECWSGSDACDQYSRHGDSQLCIGANYTMCDINDDSECTGQGNANFVYLLLEGEYCISHFTLNVSQNLNPLCHKSLLTITHFNQEATWNKTQ